MNYEETIAYIKNTAKFGSNYGLSRTEKILELLGNPHKKIKCIHIAGTNGKGSTTAIITNVLMKAGYKVGMYTSPYLMEFEERIQINGQNISKVSLCDIVTRVSRAVDEVAALGYEHPTEFEIITCAMFLYFYEEKTDFAVIEVGLGGRLDSTNVITPMLSIITSISYDHMNILGDTLEKIAFEKAGIIKRGVPVVLFPQEDEVNRVIEKVCSEKECRLICVPKDCAEYKGVSTENHAGAVYQSISLHGSIQKYNIELSLLGKHQLLNCATAIYALEQLKELGAGIEYKYILDGLRTVRWPGRLEILKNNPLVVIDGAHNIDGISKLTESIDIYFKYDKIILILGILADKQVEAMVKTIVPKASKVLTVTPNSSRAEISDELAVICRRFCSDTKSYKSYKEAYEKAIESCTDRDLLLISGSLYMIGDMRKIIISSVERGEGID